MIVCVFLYCGCLVFERVLLVLGGHSKILCDGYKRAGHSASWVDTSTRVEKTLAGLGSGPLGPASEGSATRKVLDRTFSESRNLCVKARTDRLELGLPSRVLAPLG